MLRLSFAGLSGFPIISDAFGADMIKIAGNA